MNFGGVVGRRPAVIVSNDRANSRHSVVIVAMVTNTVPEAQYPSVLRLAELCDPGPMTGCARFDAVQAVPRANVDEGPAHVLQGDDIEALNRCLRDAVGL